MPQPGGIVELPSFSNEDTSRPTVQMPPLAEQRRPPASIDDAFDGGLDDEPVPPDEPRDRVRVPTLLGMAPLAAPRRPAAPAAVPGEQPPRRGVE